MKVIEDKAATWAKVMDCPDCKSPIEIHAGDVTYQGLVSGPDEIPERHYSARCGACKTSIPLRGLPNFVKAKAKKQ